MPIHQLSSGKWAWGSGHGAFSSKAGAERQERAARANGWTGKAADKHYAHPGYPPPPGSHRGPRGGIYETDRGMLDMDLDTAIAKAARVAGTNRVETSLRKTLTSMARIAKGPQNPGLPVQRHQNPMQKAPSPPQRSPSQRPPSPSAGEKHYGDPPPGTATQTGPRGGKFWVETQQTPKHPFQPHPGNPFPSKEHAHAAGEKSGHHAYRVTAHAQQQGGGGFGDAVKRQFEQGAQGQARPGR